MRPCDYSFEPDPELPLGLGCLYAQVRSCAAPCLMRVSEDQYRELAARAATRLADMEHRDEEERVWLPDWVAGAGHGLVVERGRSGVELYPVKGGGVLDEASTRCPLEELDESVASLRWSAPEALRDDRPWLLAWLHSPRKTGAYLPVNDPELRPGLVGRIRAALGVGAS